MANDSGQPQKKPVKRVVKKPVSKPAAKSTPTAGRPPVNPETKRVVKKPTAPKAATTQQRDRFKFPSMSQFQIPTAPTFAPSTASALSGLVVGVFAVGVILVASAILTSLRGTPAGGGWGLAALILIVIAAIMLGGRLLTWLGVPEPLATSLVGVLAVLTVILGLLLDLAHSGWATVFVPVLGAVSFAGVHLVISRLAMAPRN